jgi:hypothetical protein
MKTTVIKTGRPKGAKTRFPGIGKLASRLRVHPQHLRLVFNGERSSETLLSRYNALVRKSSTHKRKSTSKGKIQ